MMISGAVLGATAAAVLFRRYLPRTPGLNRMLLEPPSSEEMERISTREALVDFRDLLGQKGVTTTPLMPSGKARFGGRLVDVIARGEVLDRERDGRGDRGPRQSGDRAVRAGVMISSVGGKTCAGCLLPNGLLAAAACADGFFAAQYAKIRAGPSPIGYNVGVHALACFPRRADGLPTLHMSDRRSP